MNSRELREQKLKQALKQEAIYQYARDSYAGYFLLSNQAERAKMNKLDEFICRKLQPIVDGEEKFYIVEMPPQHGKSMTITKTFPSYYLMKNPEKKVMIATYTQDLYTDFSDANRQKFERYAPRLAGLKIGTNTRTEFSIKDHDGGFYATSIMGGATGRKANLLIIDDPIKNAQEAHSATAKANLLREWQQSFVTRLHPGTSVIVVMTRWTVDDLAGTLLKEQAFPWEELKFPAIAENIPDGQTDELGRVNGDYLAPEIQRPSDIMRAKKSMTQESFAAMYQQRPMIEGGNIFKADTIHYYLPDRETATKLGLDHDENVVILPNIEKRWSSWDLTFTDKDQSDFVAGQTWGKQGTNFYLLDRVHARMDFNRQLAAIKAMHQRQPQAKGIYIEDKANGSAIINVLRTAVSGIVAIKPNGDKVTRANVVIPFFEAGNIFLPHPDWQPWVREMVEEWTGFPNMAHDDEVDSMTQALSREVEGQTASVTVSNHGLDQFY